MSMKRIGHWWWKATLIWAGVSVVGAAIEIYMKTH